MDQPARRVLSTLLLTAAASVAMAGPTYRWVDAQGVVHYSDTPQPGAQQVALPPPQTYHATAVPAADANSSTPVDNTAAYQSCAVVQPTAQQSLFSPEAVHISVGLMPPLRSGDTLLTTLDGSPLTAINDGGVDFQVNAIDRGQHTVTAVVRNSAGNVVCTAVPVTFYVQRPSIANPVSPIHPH